MISSVLYVGVDAMFRNVKSVAVCVVFLFLVGVVQAAPDASTSVELQDCDYTDAVPNDGWGWSESTFESCEPVANYAIDYYVSLYEISHPDATYDELIELIRADYCDYGDAQSQSGYGWNKVLRQSCSPLTDHSNLPVVVAQLPLQGEQFPLHPVVDSHGTIYVYRPATGYLVAMKLDGLELWRIHLRAWFATDIKLSATEDFIVVSSLGGRHGAFSTTDGSLSWSVDVEDIKGNPPTIEFAGDSIIAHYVPESESSAQPFIAAYDFAGVEKWKYESDHQIDEYSVGRDGLIYVILTQRDTGNKMFVTLMP